MIFENVETALVLLGQLQNLEKYTREIFSKSPFQTCDYKYECYQVKFLWNQLLTKRRRYTKLPLLAPQSTMFNNSFIHRLTVKSYVYNLLEKQRRSSPQIASVGTTA